MVATWIQTIDNYRFDLIHPDPAMIKPESLSVVLGRICRFGGHCIEFYSVAQHSLLVESLIEEEELKLPALLHDAHEAYWGFGDVCSPAKHLTKSLRLSLTIHAARIDEAVATRFGFDPKLFHHPSIKHADLVARATEKRDLMGEPPSPWGDLPAPIEEEIQGGMHPDIAALFFRQRLLELWV